MSRIGRGRRWDTTGTHSERVAAATTASSRTRGENIAYPARGETRQISGCSGSIQPVERARNGTRKAARRRPAESRPREPQRKYTSPARPIDPKPTPSLCSQLACMRANTPASSATRSKQFENPRKRVVFMHFFAKVVPWRRERRGNDGMGPDTLLVCFGASRRRRSGAARRSSSGAPRALGLESESFAARWACEEDDSGVSGAMGNSSDSRSVRELGSEFPLAAIESKGGLRARRRARRERTIARAAAALCPSGARSPGTGGRGYGRATSTDATARPKHLETSAFPRR